jgi:prepilin-type N-terminal cleavage/methylation domain-containing protein
MKFKAFSLIEIIVALFLSAIIISAVYSGYLFTHQQFFRFAAVKTEIRNYFKLAEVLNREFETSKRVLKIGERRVDIELIDKTIKYTFENDFILRRVNEQVDSFFVNLQRIEID